MADAVHIALRCKVEVAVPAAGRKHAPRKASAIGLAVSRSRSSGAVFLVAGEEIPAALSLATAPLSTAVAAMCYPLASLACVHAKPELLAKGRVTIELRVGSTTHSLFVRDCDPAELSALVQSLVEGARRCKGPGGLDGAAGVALLQDHFPEQCKKALKDRPRGSALDDASPQPIKGRVRLMMVVEAAGSTAQESGRRAATALADYFGLKPAAGAKGGASSGFTVALHAVDGGKRVVQLRVLPASHHKLKAPVWVDVDVDLAKLPPPNSKPTPSQPHTQTGTGEEPAGPDGNGAYGNGVDGKGADGSTPASTGGASALVAVEAVLARAVPAPAATVRYSAFSIPHRAVLERLPANLTCHLRSGIVAKAGAADETFSTRFELRNAAAPASAPPLGRCDLAYYEPAAMLAGPVAVALRMHKEGCRGWAGEGKDRQMGALGTILVERVEIFCQRLIASATGDVRASRALLVAGWMPEVTVAPFVRREFLFHDQDPDTALGSKFLKDISAPAQSKKRRASDETDDAGGIEGGGSTAAGASTLAADGGPPPATPTANQGAESSTDEAAGQAAQTAAAPTAETPAAGDTDPTPRVSVRGGGSPRTEMIKGGHPHGLAAREAEAAAAAEAEAWAGADTEELGELGKAQGGEKATGGPGNDDEAEALLAEALGDIGAETGGEGEAGAPHDTVMETEAVNEDGADAWPAQGEAQGAEAPDADMDIDATIAALMQG